MKIRTTNADSYLWAEESEEACTGFSWSHEVRCAYIMASRLVLLWGPECVNE